MELSKNFEHANAEEKWYQHWLDKRYFNSKPDQRQPYSVVIPPPNVTGALHMGHTLNETVQDILVRKARMSGFNACWVPGSDHASIATEAKVVEMLEKEKGIKKQDIGREEFLKYAYEWREKYGDIIYHQIRKLGCSVDWDRVVFTMDPHYYKAVIKVFVDLYNKGQIYRGARMINWDPQAKTALSDEEVEYREIKARLYYIKYFIADEARKNNERKKQNSDFVIIATQRPETIMGDTAVCVNPTDERFAHLKGKFAIVPLVNRKVPVIFDEYVDKEFGTGVLKITPAHDINDYNLGLKHNLEIVDTLNEDGTLSEGAKVFVGLDRFEARKKVVEKLRELGLLVKEEEYTTRLGFSQRTNAVVEPRISTQWFVKMKKLADKALNAVTSGNIKIHPEERFLATYKYWMENIKDWCISRQLWWGQRIPAWYDDQGNVFVAATEAEAYQLATSHELRAASKESSKLEAQSSKLVLTQDEDVLDTWFSSWLWPIEVFRGITNPANEDIKYYYPTSVLVTGQDIIFFWVARMIMAGMEYMNEKPFDDVYFTGMVRDKQGRKMSKQLGNSPDLLDLIGRFGADAVRFGIMISSPAGNDLLFDEASLEQGRNFNNKIWNALKLVRSWESRVGSRQSEENFAVEWFENRLNEVKSDLAKMFEDFRLNEALKTIYSLTWDDFCSWYLEWVKPGLNQPIDHSVYEKTVSFFEELLQLLHPFMPFITEEIYHQLKERKNGDDLCIKQFSVPGSFDRGILEEGSLLKEFITEIRNAKIRYNINKAFEVYFTTNNYSSMFGILQKQVKANDIRIIRSPLEDFVSIVIRNNKIYLHTEKAIDKNSQKEELQKELEYLKGFLSSVDRKLNNERFLQNAKPEVLSLEQKKKADAEAKIRVIEESLAGLGESR